MGRKPRRLKQRPSNGVTITDDVDVELRRQQLDDAVHELASESALPSVVPGLHDAIADRTAKAIQAVARIFESLEPRIRPVFEKANAACAPVVTWMHMLADAHQAESRTDAHAVDDNVAQILTAIYSLERANNARNEVAMHSWQEATTTLIAEQNSRIQEVTVHWKSEVVRLTHEVHLLKEQVRGMQRGTSPAYRPTSLPPSSDVRGRTVVSTRPQSREASRDRLAYSIERYKRSNAETDLTAAVQAAQQLATFREDVPAAFFPSLDCP